MIRRPLPSFSSSAFALVLALSGCGGTGTATTSAEGSASIGDGETGSSSGGESGSSSGLPSSPSHGASGNASTPPPSRPVGVPLSRARYYVGVADASTLANDVGPELLTVAGDRIRATLASQDGVALAPDHESAEAGAAVARAHAIHGVYVRCSVRRIEAGPQGTRAAVAVLVTTLDARDVLASLQGGALVPGPTGAEATREALASAVDSALRGMPGVFASLESRSR